MSTLFVDRSDELARLAAGLRDVRLALIVGLPGAGKSALAHRFAASWSGTHAAQQVPLDGSPALVIDEARRALAGGDAPRPGSDREAIADLATRMDERRQLLVLEDADRAPGLAPLLEELAHRLRSGRVLATARARLYAPGAGPERVEIVLGGLPEPAARQLWHLLDALYGRSPDFAAAWRRGRGNPSHLRQAHAGGVDLDDPARVAIDALGADARRLGLALALAARPLPGSILLGLLPRPRARRALEELLARLVAEPAGDQRFAVPDVLGDALVRGSDPALRRELHGSLADLLAADAGDPIASIRERARHLLAAGARPAARELILASAGAMLREGAGVDLARSLEQIDDGDDVEVRLARARAMIGTLELRRGHELLVALDREGHLAGSDPWARLAEAALLTGRLDVAEREASPLPSGPDGAPAADHRREDIRLLGRTLQGHGAAARAEVGDDDDDASRPVSARARLSLVRALSCWLEDRDAEALEAATTALALDGERVASPSRVLEPMLVVTILARAGRDDDASELLAVVDRRLAERRQRGLEGPLVLAWEHAMRAVLLDCRGCFSAALAEAEIAVSSFTRAGHVPGSMWARLQHGRLLMLVGRVREGSAGLAALARDAMAAGAQLFVRLAGDAVDADPVRALGIGPTVGTRPGARRRTRVIEALRALADGDAEVARAYAVALASGPALDPLDRALLQLVRAGLVPAAERTPLLREAFAIAAAGGADPELVPLVASQVGLWTSDRRSARITIDTDAHRVVAGERVLSLARRPSVRGLLYTLASAPGRTFDKEALSRGIWNARYRPAHDGAIWVNVKRLRDLLDGTGLRVESSDDGYQLCVDAGHELELISARAPDGTDDDDASSGPAEREAPAMRSTVGR